MNSESTIELGRGVDSFSVGNCSRTLGLKLHSHTTSTQLVKIDQACRILLRYLLDSPVSAEAALTRLYAAIAPADSLWTHDQVTDSPVTHPSTLSDNDTVPPVPTSHCATTTTIPTAMSVTVLPISGRV